MKNKTISKNFYDSQIIGVYIDEEGKRCIYLKMGVRKQFNPGYIEYEDCYQRNEVLDNFNMHKKVNMILYGEGDFSDSYD